MKIKIRIKKDKKNDRNFSAFNQSQIKKIGV